MNPPTAAPTGADTPTLAVEIAVQDPAGARIAVEGGADRVELCQALGVGGLTPSMGLVERTVEAVGGARVAPLVRPRPGGFVYDADEVATVAAEIRSLVGAGVGAVVVGCLTAQREVDLDTLARWVDASAGAAVVFHRAIDVADDPAALVEPLAQAGVTRILTSGGAVRSIEGTATLTRMVSAAGQAVQIMAGGGVRVPDIPTLRGCGLDAVHLSARGRSGDRSPSGPGGGAEDGFDVTDPDIVHAAVAASRG